MSTPQDDNQPVVWAVLVAVIVLAVGLAIGFGIAKSKKAAPAAPAARPSDGEPAVDRHRRAGDPARLRARQPRDGRRDLLRRQQPLERLLSGERLG